MDELKDLENELNEAVEEETTEEPEEDIDVLGLLQGYIPPTDSLDVPFYEVVIRRLKTLGFEITSEDDAWLIWFCGHKVEEYIKNFCNIPLIPKELYYTAAEMVCGELFRDKLSTGTLSLGGSVITGGQVTQIREGDTTVSFSQTTSSGGGSSTGTIEDLIDTLTQKDGELICFRKLRW